jgi:hypothetical protein
MSLGQEITGMETVQVQSINNNNVAIILRSRSGRLNVNNAHTGDFRAVSVNNVAVNDVVSSLLVGDAGDGDRVDVSNGIATGSIR